MVLPHIVGARIRTCGGSQYQYFWFAVINGCGHKAYFMRENDILRRSSCLIYIPVSDIGNQGFYWNTYTNPKT